MPQKEKVFPLAHSYSMNHDISQKKNRLFNDSLRRSLQKTDVSNIVTYHKLMLDTIREFKEKMRCEGAVFCLEDDVKILLSQLEIRANNIKNSKQNQAKVNYQKKNREFNESLRIELSKKHISNYDAHHKFILRRVIEYEEIMRNACYSFSLEKDVKVLLSQLEAKAAHQNAKPWAYKDFIFAGIDENSSKARSTVLSDIERTCSTALIEDGLKEIHMRFSQNRVDISVCQRSVHFSYSCSGRPSDMSCDGRTFRSGLVDCVNSVGSIKDADVLYALEYYYRQHNFRNISLAAQLSSKPNLSEVNVHGVVEKDNIQFKIKLLFDSNNFVKEFGSINLTPYSEKKSLPSIDDMDGHQFESFCAELLKKNGFESANVTRGSGDQGIDIIAYRDGIKYGIQCKCYSSDIGNKAVQEVYAGKAFYECHIGVVLTNQYFTKAAVDLAKKNGVILWDRKKLLGLVENANRNE